MLSPLALGYTGGQALSLMEAGTNGISAYMLGRLSRLFDVPLGAFYANGGGGHRHAWNVLRSVRPMQPGRYPV